MCEIGRNWLLCWCISDMRYLLVGICACCRTRITIMSGVLTYVWLILVLLHLTTNIIAPSFQLDITERLKSFLVGWSFRTVLSYHFRSFVRHEYLCHSWQVGLALPVIFRAVFSYGFNSFISYNNLHGTCIQDFSLYCVNLNYARINEVQHIWKSCGLKKHGA